MPTLSSIVESRNGAWHESIRGLDAGGKFFFNAQSRASRESLAVALISQGEVSRNRVSSVNEDRSSRDGNVLIDFLLVEILRSAKCEK